MSRQPSRNTGPELALRRQLHALGLRYRLHVKPLVGVRRTVDIAFSRAKLAVFVDGCFWHRCAEHATFPKSRAEWWDAKLARNVERDVDTDRRLAEAGWSVIRIWEHEDPVLAAARISQALATGNRGASSDDRERADD